VVGPRSALTLQCKGERLLLGLGLGLVRGIGLHVDTTAYFSRF